MWESRINISIQQLVNSARPANPSGALLLSLPADTATLWRCIDAEPRRKSPVAALARRPGRMLVIATSSPSCWCSDTPANCLTTARKLFTTSRDSISSRGWGTRASWSIGRLIRCRSKANAKLTSLPFSPLASPKGLFRCCFCLTEGGGKKNKSPACLPEFCPYWFSLSLKRRSSKSSSVDSTQIYKHDQNITDDLKVVLVTLIHSVNNQRPFRSILPPMKLMEFVSNLLMPEQPV